MGRELEKFVQYSIRYQILLAQHVANICNMNVHIFDKNGYFDHESEVKIELIDGVRTVSKEGYRAVLSVAVKESFGSNEKLFLKFVDENVAQRDHIGLYVVSPVKTNLKKEEPQKNEEPLYGSKEPEIESKQDLKDIADAIEKLDSIL